MKNLSKSLLLVAFLVGITIPSWGQTSTEGKRFWIALPFSNGPSGALQDFEPFIAISAKKECMVTLSQPAGTWGLGTAGNPVQQFKVGADSWNIVSNGLSFTTALTIPDNVWYNKNWTFTTASEPITPFSYGILVEATEDISVYAAMRGNASYDATNVLPEPTLRSEYILQDYPGYDHQGDCGHSVFVIVGTENNTEVEIEYTAPTVGGTAAGTKRTISLNKGQTYQALSEQEKTFSGTKITAKNGKKIAVFSGADFTQVPGAKSARDCLYEQAMPIDYWGTQFVVTRSMLKDANRVRITALTNGTTVTIDGIEAQQLNKGETYEFEMSENLAKGDMASAISNVGRTAPDVFSGDVHYIETSCPCAVFNYDVSSGYVHSNNNNKVGDPSMVWMSPLQQRIKKITFGACGTKKRTECYTNEHYVNIVCLTEDTSTFLLTSASKPSGMAVNFTPVPGNPKYSYARVYLGKVGEGEAANADKVFTMSCDMGFIAHVYGSGKNESYAYSVGSSAVKQGVQVNERTFTEGMISDVSFCIDDSLTFEALSGTDEISRIDWDFGDGKSVQNGEAKTTHKYTVPGWYDLIVSAVYVNECTNTEVSNDMHFSFRVDRPDTLYRNVTLCADSVPKYRFDEIPNSKTFAMKDQTVDEIIVDTITAEGDCSNVYILTINAVSQRLDTIDLDKVYPIAQRRDSALIPADGYDTGEGLGLYHPTAEYVYTGGYYVRHYYRSNTKCDSTVMYHVTVVKCLDLKAENTQQTVCYMDSIHNLTFSYDRDGNPGSMDLWIDGKKNCPIIFGDKDSKVDDGVSRIHISASAVPDKVYPGYHKAVIKMKDINCDTIAESEPFNLTVLYPDSIFAYKFDNVLTMYKKEHGGNIPGWDFVRYEWYHNDDTIPCGTGPVYHTDEPFTIGDTYYVVLTRTDGMVLRSCEFEIQNHGGIERSGKGNAPDSDGNDTGNMPTANAPAKFIQNRQLYILFEGAVYNMYGQRVKSND